MKCGWITGFGCCCCSSTSTRDFGGSGSTDFEDVAVVDEGGGASGYCRTHPRFLVFVDEWEEV